MSAQPPQTLPEEATPEEEDEMIDGAVEDIFEYIKRVRKETGLLSRALDDEPPRKVRSLDALMTLFKSQVGAFNLTPAQIEWFYPQSRGNADFSIHEEHLHPNAENEIKFLNDLLPLVIPGDNYFEEGELDALNSKDYPLRFSVQHYIRTFFFISTRLFSFL